MRPNDVNNLSRIRTFLRENMDSEADEEMIEPWLGTIEVLMQQEDDTIRALVAECEDAYVVLDELEEQLSEACEEQTTWKEEIDRQNLRKLLDDLDAVQRVKLLIMEIVDPHGPPTPDDPIPPGGTR